MPGKQMLGAVARAGRSYSDPVGVLKALGRAALAASSGASRGEKRLFLRHCNLVVDAVLRLLKLEQGCLDAIKALSALIDAYDSYTGGHSQKVRDCSVAICRELGLNRSETNIIECAAYMHDIGKIGVGSGIIRKPVELTDAEKERVRTHPCVGAEIVRQLGFLDDAVPLILHHHEHFNGKGYPRGLRKNKIPLGARILCVADSFDAMTSDRTYRKADSREEGLRKLKAGAGEQFDPRVVKALVRSVRCRERSS